MKYSDYIPLATTPTSGRLQFDEHEIIHARPHRSRHRRRWVILGTGVSILLITLYFISVDLGNDAGHIFHDKPNVSFLPAFDAAYLPFEPPAQNLTDSDSTSLTPTQVLPDHCRDAYFSSGAVCYDPHLPAMDIVWTWVNGSDPLLEAAKLDVESHFSADDPYRPKTSVPSVRQYRWVHIRSSLVLLSAHLWIQEITMNFDIPCGLFWPILGSIPANSISSPPTFLFPTQI